MVNLIIGNLISKKCPNCKGGGIKTFSNFLKIRCPNMGGGEGGSTRLGQVQVLHFFFKSSLTHFIRVFGKMSSTIVDLLNMIRHSNRS